MQLFNKNGDEIGSVEVATSPIEKNNIVIGRELRRVLHGQHMDDFDNEDDPVLVV